MSHIAGELLLLMVASAERFGQNDSSMPCPLKISKSWYAAAAAAAAAEALRGQEARLREEVPVVSSTMRCA